MIELPDHPGYFLFEDGRVYRTPSSKTKGGFLKMSEVRPCLHRYCIGRKKYFVHRLVGRYYLEDFDEKLNVCHKDETLPLDKLHHKDNLWMGTQQENVTDCWNKGRGRPKPPRDEYGRFTFNDKDKT